MKVTLLILALLCLVNSEINPTKALIRVKTLTKIKENAGWEPYPIDENPFKDYTHADLNKLLGAELTWTSENMMAMHDDDNHKDKDNIPDAFDSRTQWPDCVTPIRSQDHCGSCWAFSAATAFSDRICIASEGRTKVVLSPQYLVSCDKKNSACKGGLLDRVWNFLETEGTTTDSCFDYKSGDGKFVPQCPVKCDNDAEEFITYKAVKGASKGLTCALQIQKEIIANGPLQTGFMVYQDFMHYKSGVYKFTQGKKLGGHAVRVVGWGKDANVSYWIVANSWGPLWGETGFFRIAFGECLFDVNGYTGFADLNAAPRLFLE